MEGGAEVPPSTGGSFGSRQLPGLLSDFSLLWEAGIQVSLVLNHQEGNGAAGEWSHKHSHPQALHRARHGCHLIIPTVSGPSKGFLEKGF